MHIYLAGNGPKAKYDMLREREDELQVYLAGGMIGNLHPLWVDLHKDIKIHLAGNSPWHEHGLYDIAMRRGRCYILESFYYADQWTEKTIPYLESFMLDSGAFTFFNSGKRVDWDEYIERYADFINRNHVDLFFELDIDSLIGYERVKEMRKRLEELTGKQPIPVWHISRGKDEFLRMCDEYPYVAIGGVVIGEIKQKDYKAFPWFIKEAHKRNAKIHGLGFTNLEGLRKYHFDSVDSTAWVSGNRFGSVYKFNGKTMVKYDKNSNQRLSDSKAVALNNFNEWLKFQHYAKTHL